MKAPGPSDHPSTEDRTPSAAHSGETCCLHCGAWNPADEHRCRVCQHRLRPGGARASQAAPHQGLLFGGAERPKVIPFESIAPGRAAAARVPKPAASKPPAARPKAATAQQSLDLAAPVTRLRPATQPAVCCDAPIAPRLGRCAAAAVDAAIVLVGLGLFLATFHLLGGPLVLGKRTAPYYGGAALALAAFYKCAWTLAGRDSMGLRCAGLRLLNFDGQPPTPRQRVLRLAGACISFCALGGGLLWALLDREKLTWHDHISSTFPTPRR